MATDLQPGVPGEALTERPKVFGLFSMVLFSVSAIFSFPAEGTSRDTFWLITGGGTIVSLLIGWWLYRQASHTGGGATAVTASDAQG